MHPTSDNAHQSEKKKRFEPILHIVFFGLLGLHSAIEFLQPPQREDKQTFLDMEKDEDFKKAVASLVDSDSFKKRLDKYGKPIPKKQLQEQAEQVLRAYQLLGNKEKPASFKTRDK